MPPVRPAFALLAALLAGCSGTTTTQPAPTPTGTPTATPSASAAPTYQPDDPLSPRPALESAAPLGQPVCDPAQLTLADADAVVDQRWTEVFVLRTDGRPCQLEGFPRVTLRDDAGNALPEPVTAARTATKPVTLSAGTSVSFTLTTDRTGSCHQAATVEAVLPGTATPLTTATTLQACGRVEVGPVERRADEE